MTVRSLVGLPAPHRRHHAILVVDDDPEICALLDGLLRDEEYRCVSRPSLDEALGLLRIIRFTLILSDAFSPTAAAALASTTPLLAAAGATPVVLCTAHAVDERAAQRAGFAAVISKPFDVEDVLATVARLLPQPRTAVRLPSFA